MALRAVEGWDGYDVGLSGSTWNNIFRDKWSNSYLPSTASVTALNDRYTGEKTLYVGNNTGYWSADLTDNPEEVACGLYVRNTQHAYERSSDDWIILYGINYSSYEHVELSMNGRDIRVKVRNGVVDEIISNVIESYRWNLVELKTKIHDTTGYWYVYVNGVLVGSHTNIDTKYSTYNVDRVTFRHQDNYSYTGDWYVCDLTGSKNNDVLGPFHIQGILPDANGNDSDWTPSTANVDNYTMVDEATANESDYVASNTANEQDLYNYANITGTWDEIFGLQINTRAFLDVAGSETLAVLCSSNSTESSANFTLTNTTMADGDEEQFQRILETDPDTSNAWDANGIDAAQFGIKFI